ncbi:AbrB/MazE/SpoVT family DNA-binding domain-containing protein [Acidithiobacillus ferrooxidans]|jgi:antitoxin MazE|uniref:AbrB/MazE/SpoVT family DNA-binding domain-containing protein n=1 Tax=Acidithiobacillus ferrooxidans TaxID=920 RepID=UPI001C073101|nr:AbrB/MazE/SpoVT family DNA-binding domain-containing protein [Acidithiobacillus ferrooxidans]MBU2856749.1 AbrB/MazE/SpoVT family DNA-binding domain-containing protein [Acidithiobacillus ferrooxidans]MBU2861702.1 AbrB/MazE/SpoVT family DNA-binding domain-containing protein [Acidithiobacillus ferrooxidans]MCL5956710.1 AbrB/MazE/SpoVT family DNA-binding domain-containing protein [Gammaproteobacteria bacterium]MCR2831362.1 AbrB/MazE/SpoVT family DNA-binding domain-containing protein [Acidithioba
MATCLIIRKWGNNLGVRLPATIANEARLHADQEVRLSVEHGRVIVEPIGTTADLTLEDRLTLFDPALHGGEAMATERVGAEVW